jgi:hypothetical protein
MLSALEFWNVEKRDAIDDANRALAKNGIESAEVYPPIWQLRRFDDWTQADWMDFAERYADYVCDYEKRDNYVNAKTEERHVRDLSM